MIRHRKQALTMMAIAAMAVTAAAGAETNRAHVLPELEVVPVREEYDVFRRLETEPAGLGIAQSTVYRADIERQNARTLTDALEFAMGAWTETRGRKVKQFTSFRGQTYPYPDYALDGLWFREFHELPYVFPAHAIERIEVTRSSAALLSGLSSAAGVINVVPREHESRLTALDAFYGTFDTIDVRALHAEPLANGSLFGSLSHYRTDGPSDENAAERLTTGGVLFRRKQERLTLSCAAYALDGFRELRLADETAAARFRTQREAFDPFRAALFAGTLRFDWSENQATELALWGAGREADFSRFNAQGGLVASSSDDDYEYGAQALQAMRLHERNTLRVGGLYHRWVAPEGKRFYSGRRQDLHTVSAVAVDEHDFGRLVVDAGLRYQQEYIDEYGAFSIEGSGAGFRNVEPVTDEWAEPLWRANGGGRYRLSDAVSLYFNAGYAGVDPRSGALTEENVEPDMESRRMLDGGVGIDLARFGRLKLGGFYWLRDDAVLLTGNTYLDAAGNEYEYYENRDLLQYGLELEWRSARYFGALSGFASVLAMESEARDAGGSYVEFEEVPDEVAAAGLYLDIDRFDASIFGQYVGSYENDRFAADGQPYPLGDYADLNVVLGWRFGSERRTRLYCELENLLDDEYYTVVGYPDPGFSVGAGLQHRF